MLHDRIGLAGLIAAVVVGAAGAGTPAQDEPADEEAPVERLQSATDDGDWHGTWTYVNRNEQMMLWIDAQGETPRVRVQYFSLATPEAFQTDWNGSATYELGKEPATFHMNLTQADANRIHGTWLWDVQFSSAGRTERGVFTLYRVGDGRQLAIDFSEYEKVQRRAGKVSRYSGPASWYFKKVSKRHVLWQEVF